MPDGMVMTVRGPVPAGDLGITLPHEHLLADSTVWLEEPRDAEEAVLAGDSVRIEVLGLLRRNPLFMRDNLLLDDEHLALEEILRFKALGGRTVVDTSSIGLGRDVEALRRISQASGLNIVAGCGFYVEASHPDWLEGTGIEEIRDAMLRDVQEGIGGSGVRAGIIGEIGTGYRMTVREERVLRAAGQAQRATGLAVTIHMGGCAAEARRVLDVLAEEGADLSRVILGHMDDDLGDFASHLEAAARGAYVEYDSFGAEWYVDSLGTRTARDDERIEAVVRMAEADHLDKVLISQDIWLKQSLRRYGGFGYDHILRTIVPELKRSGLDDASIRQLLVANPGRVLSGE